MKPFVRVKDALDSALKVSDRATPLASDRARPQDPFPIILAIDPSMVSLGWAVYNANMGADRYDILSKAWRFGVIHPRATEVFPPQYKWGDAYRQLRRQLGDWWPSALAIEWPTFFSSTAGHIAAQKDHTINLAGMAGYLAGRFRLLPDFIFLWTPNQWKGSVPKSVTKEKFIRLFGPGAPSIARAFSDDTIDAIMLAENYLSMYMREKLSWQKKMRAQK